jgi:hypothetical protein
MHTNEFMMNGFMTLGFTMGSFMTEWIHDGFITTERMHAHALMDFLCLSTD